jgi:hypothetical protein
MTMFESSRPEGQPVEAVAAALLRSLFEGVAGEPPLALRAYHDDDTVLLLLRFDASLFEDTSGIRFEPLVEISLMAMTELIAEAVEERTGRKLVPGDLSVCAERGLAVFAFALGGPERQAREDTLRLALAGL